MLISEGLEILTEDECMALFGSTTVGRVGITIGALPAIFVVNYVLVDGDIVFRTSDGTKLEAALRHAVVAFEADLTDPVHHQGWAVQAVGIADELDPTDVTFSGPTPWAQGEREHFVRIRPEFVSGRRIVRDLSRDLTT